MKKMHSVVLVLCLVISLLVACSTSGSTRSSKKPSRSSKSQNDTTQLETEPEADPAIVGRWYNDTNEFMIFYDDSTWSFGDYDLTGEWKSTQNGATIELNLPSGDQQKLAVNTDAYGAYYAFDDYGVFYKDAYPEELLDTTVKIDPFEGIAYEVGGISPYCTIAINTQKCSEEAQNYVTYTLDKEQYSNGDTAIITATLNDYTDDTEYSLTAETTEFTVSGQSEYVTSADQIDMDFLTGEVEDKITALISESIGEAYLCNVYCPDVVDTSSISSGDLSFLPDWAYTSASPTLKAIYASTIKTQKRDTVSDSVPYNMYSFLYCLDVATTLNGNGPYEGKLYVNITANNVVHLTDGTTSWDDEHYNLDVFTSTDGLDNCITTTIMCNSDNYNITNIMPAAPAE